MRTPFLTIRRKLFRYRIVEQALARDSKVKRLLDLGCGDGGNMLRFSGLTLQIQGIDISAPRLRQAKGRGLAVAQSSGEHLPFARGTFDLIYVAHVLHHVPDFAAVLREIRRCLASQGKVFIVETVSDNPILRLARNIRPKWRGDSVVTRWYYAELVRTLEDHGYFIEASERFNVFFFLWEMLPLAFPPFELFTPLFICLDLILARVFSKFSAHCYFVLSAGRRQVRA